MSVLRYYMKQLADAREQLTREVEFSETRLRHLSKALMQGDSLDEYTVQNLLIVDRLATRVNLLREMVFRLQAEEHVDDTDR